MDKALGFLVPWATPQCSVVVFICQHWDMFSMPHIRLLVSINIKLDIFLLFKLIASRPFPGGSYQLPDSLARSSIGPGGQLGSLSVLDH